MENMVCIVYMQRQTMIKYAFLTLFIYRNWMIFILRSLFSDFIDKWTKNYIFWLIEKHWKSWIQSAFHFRCITMQNLFLFFSHQTFANYQINKILLNHFYSVKNVANQKFKVMNKSFDELFDFSYFLSFCSSNIWSIWRFWVRPTWHILM